jgi:hypothetical protein
VDGQRDHLVKVWGFQQVAATEEARRVVAGAAITGSRKEGIASSDKGRRDPVPADQLSPPMMPLFGADDTAAIRG